MARYRSFSSEFKRRRASSPSASPSGLRTNFPVNRHIKSIVRLHRVEAVGPASFQGAKRHLRGIRPGNRGSAVLHHPPLAAAHPSFPYEIPAGMPAPDCLRQCRRRAAPLRVGVRRVPGHGYRGPVHLALSPALKARMEPRDEPTSVSATSLAPTTVAPAAVESELDPGTPAQRFLWPLARQTTSSRYLGRHALDRTSASSLSSALALAFM
jgi:hypothetical protein